MLMAYGLLQVQAAPADSFSLTGRLTDAGGVPLNGDYDVVVRLYDAATQGILLYEDAHTAAAGGLVQVQQGLYDLAVGMARGVLASRKRRWHAPAVVASWVRRLNRQPMSVVNGSSL